jgi:hypothetical protein
MRSFENVDEGDIEEWLQSDVYELGYFLFPFLTNIQVSYSGVSSL